MLRRSDRLNTSGYYNSDGEPAVSYKERHNGFTRPRRLRRRYDSGHNDISSFINTTHDTSIDSQGDLTTSQLDRTTSQVNMATSNSRGFHICHGLLWKLSLCLVLVVFICGLYMNGVFLGPRLPVSPVPPIQPTIQQMEQLVTPMESAVPPIEPTVLNPLEEMEKTLKEMTDELHGLKWRLNYRPPGETMHNFALESQGAHVLEDMSSKTYHDRGGLFLFGIPIFTISKESHNPSIVTEGKLIQVGRCWPFQGESGHLVIALSQPITITHVSVAHASKNMMLDGTITSAPKTFAVYGMKAIEDEGTLLGTFFYDRDIESMQTFKLPDQDKGVFSIVKLKVLNNWGNPDYTCIYNFRVHGSEHEQTPHPG